MILWLLIGVAIGAVAAVSALAAYLWFAPINVARKRTMAVRRRIEDTVMSAGLLALVVWAAWLTATGQ